MSLPLRFHLDRKTGALGQTLTNGLMGYRIILQHIILTVLPVVVELGTITVVLIALEHSIFLAIIGISVLFYTLTFWVGAMRIKTPAKAVSDAHIDAYAVLTDSILNYETVKYFGAESRVHGRFVKALVETEDHWTEFFKRKMQNGLVVACVFALSLGTSMYVAAREVQEGTMSIGAFVLINMYILRIIQPVETIGFAFRDIAQGMAFIEKMAELFGQKREMDLVSHSASLPTGAPNLAFQQVSYSYHSDRPVLQDINFVIPSGKTIAIVGASGSGKSSLIRLLMRMIEPTTGLICLNGVPLHSIPMSSLRNSIAVVPQDIALFNDSIAYNIGFGKQDSTEADIIEAAKVAHIHELITELPDGYDTMVGERGLKLSGGEKQRIAIARAAIKRPAIFIFDEATSSLDSRTEQAILHDLISVSKSTTTLIVAHRLSTIVHADEIVVLDKGRIVECGDHNELLQRDGVYTAMWRAQHTERSQFEETSSTTA